ncbi:MAG: hypothetical protein ABFC80_06515, partial [Coriobacteriales bacterium]
MVQGLPQRATLTFGLTFVGPSALAPLTRDAVEPATSLVRACRELDAAFAFVPWDRPWAVDAAEQLAQEGVAPFAVFQGPLWPVLEQRGVQAGLADTLLHPREIAAEIDARLGGIASRVSDAIEAGARAIVLAEDLAGGEGLLVAPDFAIEALLPRFSSLVELATSARVPVVLHSDGDIRSLLAAVKRAGFAAVHAGGGLDFEAFERLFWAVRAEELVAIGGFQTLELERGMPRAEVLGSRLGL